MNFKQFMKSTKAISPIFATLILIAIAVIAGVVVYMFVSGTLGTMMGGGTAAQEKAAIQGVEVTDSGATVYISNIGGDPAIVINGALFKDSSGVTTVGTVDPTADTSILLGTGALQGVVVDATLDAGTYTVTLTSARGGSFVSASFIVQDGTTGS